jgi:hypothetical protein
MARFVTLAVLLAIGVAIYAFTERAAAQTLRLQLAKSQSELDLYKKRTGEYTTAFKEAQATLAECKSQSAELQTALETATKKPGAKK